MKAVRVFIPTNLRKVSGAVERAVENALNNRAEDIRIDFLVTTYTWTNKPRFLIRRYRGGRMIFTENLIYKFLTYGTRPHIIIARNAPALRFFRTGFKAKTRVRYIGSMAGKKANRNLALVFPPRVVHHPGFPGREFDKVIADKWRKRMPALFQQAINAELMRASLDRPFER